MKLSSLFIEWFLHIFPLLLLRSHRYWPEMCCIWPLVNSSFSAMAGNQKLIYSKGYSDRDGVCMWACVYNADRYQMHPCIIHTHHTCVHIFFPTWVQEQPLGFPPFLGSRTFFDCLRSSQAFILPLLLFNNKTEKLPNCLPPCLFKLIGF